MTKRNAVSLFSNCGAGDFGYKKAGFNFVVMAELQKKRAEVCKLNHPRAKVIEGDLRETWTDVIKLYQEKYTEPPALLTACPPCQGLSSARGKRGSFKDPDAGSKDARNLLISIACKIIKELEPECIVIENVPIFLSRRVRHPKDGSITTGAKIFLEAVADDYLVFPMVTDLCDYNVPQTRKRCFITAIHKKHTGIRKFLLSCGRVPYPSVKNDNAPITVVEALQQHRLPSLKPTSAEEATFDGFNGMHSVPTWPAERCQMVASIPRNSGASAWENNTCTKCGYNDNRLEDVYCNNCHELLPKPIVEESGRHRLIRGFRTSYKRMAPNKPAATILTASGHIGSHTTIHPYEDRLLSLLECQILQTIPMDFRWGDALRKYGPSNVRAMIGEAIPPKFTLMHGSVLRRLFDKDWARGLMDIEDKRITKAWQKVEGLN
ncbi:MAG: DNA cytosine methyltransferase [Cyanobacteria bacterium J06600_6]